MFRPFTLFIGLRYTRAKKRNHFISFISLTSMLGIALGITVLITVLSVMNGFDQEIRNRVFSMAPQVTLRDNANPIPNWQNFIRTQVQKPGVDAAAPFVAGQGMLQGQLSMQPALVLGVEPEYETKVSGIPGKTYQGSFKQLQAGKYGIVLGEQMAFNLGVSLGDRVVLYTLDTTITPAGINPRMKPFTVVGIFKSDMGGGLDDQIAYIHLQDAGRLFETGTGVSGINIKLHDPYQAPEFSERLMQSLSTEFSISNWTDQYGPLFKAIKLEKTMMFFILLLIVAVAAFNLVSTLVMVVTDKQSDIAILRTFGATPSDIMAIFIVQGVVIGLVGTLLGLIGGVLLASNATAIVSGIEHLFHVQLISSSVYFLDYLPSQLQLSDITIICIAAFCLTLLATLYPAWRASKVQPAEALRYE